MQTEEEGTVETKDCHSEELRKHILKRSVEKEDFTVAASEWELHRMEDTLECQSVCPCTKTGLRYRCHIRNRENGRETWVGTECIKLFGDRLYAIVRTLRGLTLCCVFNGFDKYDRPNFRLHSNQLLVRNQELLQQHFGRVPIWWAYHYWLLATQNGPAKTSGLQAGQRYSISVVFRRSKRRRDQALVVDLRSVELKEDDSSDDSEETRDDETSEISLVDSEDEISHESDNEWISHSESEWLSTASSGDDDENGEDDEDDDYYRVNKKRNRSLSPVMTRTRRKTGV